MTPASATNFRGKATFYVAMGALAAAAVGQAVVAAWGVAVQDRRTMEASAVKPPPPPVETLPKPPPRAAAVNPAATGDAPVLTAIEVPAKLGEASHGIPPVRKEPEAASLVVPITDEAVLANLDKGLHLRSEGDVLGAIKALRAALEALPDHPQLIYQTAYTLDLMGEPAKALSHWKTLQSLGRGAGDFFKLAQARLSDKPQEATPLAYAEKERKLSLRGMGAHKDDKFRTGERQIVNFTIAKNTSEEVAGGDIELGIHFFDIVNGKRIDRSLTDHQPNPSYLALPMDWQEDGMEAGEVEYVRSDLTPEEVKKYGQRAFYGYVFELYWKGRLQDVKAEPAELADFAREMPEPAPEPEIPESSAANPLFPK